MNFIEPLPGVRDAAMNRVIALPPEEQNAIANESGYEMRVFSRNFDLSAAVEELEHLIDLLVRATSFQEISLLIKLYIIGWVTLADVLANLINEIFDLGYAEQDIQFGVILRNRKIVESALPAIIKRHAKAVKYDEYVRNRNDVVHRGRLDDKELLEVRGAIYTAVIMGTLHIDQSDHAAIERASTRAAEKVGATERMRELLALKRKNFSEHLAATRALFADLAPVLVKRIQTQPRRAA